MENYQPVYHYAEGSLYIHENDALQLEICHFKRRHVSRSVDHWHIMRRSGKLREGNVSYEGYGSFLYLEVLRIVYILHC